MSYLHPRSWAAVLLDFELLILFCWLDGLIR